MTTVVAVLAGCVALNDKPGPSTGGAGAGGGGASVGAGGAGGGAACQPATTRCSGASLETCSDAGQWGVATACPARQTCTGPDGAAACTCALDAVCSAAGPACATNGELAVCMRDARGCLFQSSSSPCANGACSGAAGSAACCTNACTAGTTACQSSTSVQACGTAANGCLAMMASACATGFVCERSGSPGCVDPNWAEWTMPNISGDVTAGAPNPENFTINIDGTVTDNVTGLMWQQSVPINQFNTFAWSDAMTFCPTFALAGYTDWRLPTAIELVTLVNYDGGDGAVGWADPGATALWSSTPLAGTSASAWAVNFNNYGSYSDPVSMLHSVRCVR